MAQEFYARIRPGNGVSRYALRNKLFYAKKGWYKVNETFARELAKQPLNILNPSSGPMVFEVKTRKEAKRIEDHENAKIDPAGTVDEPMTEHDESEDEQTFGDMSTEDFKGPASEPPAEGSDEDEDDEDVPGLEDAALDESEDAESPSEPAEEQAEKPAPKRRRKKVAKKTAKK